MAMNNPIRVRCFDCLSENFIEMHHVDTIMEGRTLGVEYEHTYEGAQDCSACGLNGMKLLSMIYEYPKGHLSYIDTSEEFCLLMDNMIEKYEI
jgi:hypothetical protein